MFEKGFDAGLDGVKVAALEDETPPLELLRNDSGRKPRAELFDASTIPCTLKVGLTALFMIPPSSRDA